MLPKILEFPKAFIVKRGKGLVSAIGVIVSQQETAHNSANLSEPFQEVLSGTSNGQDQTLPALPSAAYLFSSVSVKIEDHWSLTTEKFS